MNIIIAVIGLVGLKRAPECIKMHHFEGENANPTPVDAFGASIRVPSALYPPAPPFHICKYATGSDEHLCTGGAYRNDIVE